MAASFTRKLKLRFSKFSSLTWNEKKIFITSIIGLPLVNFGLRIFSTTKLSAFLENPKVRSNLSVQKITPERISELVQMASKYGNKETCLRQALVLRWHLQRRDIPCKIEYGVLRDDKRFSAHAWVDWGSTTDKLVQDNKIVRFEKNEKLKEY